MALGLFASLAVPVSAQPADDPDAPLLSDETPTQLVDKLQEDGVYIGPNRSGTEPEPLREAVAQAMEQGIEIVVLVPDDPEPTASAFARRIQEQTEVDAAIVFPPEDGAVQAYATEEFESNRTRALNRAQREASQSAAISIYVEELQNDGSRSVPVFVIILVVVVLVLLYASYGASSLLAKERKKLDVTQS